MSKNNQSHSARSRTSGEVGRLHLIKGGGFKPKAVLSHTEKESLANRWLYHGGKLPTLAWESGLTQSEIAAVAVAMERAEGFENGQRAERARMRLMPPLGRQVA